MTSISDALKAAAPEPTHFLDMGEIRRLAARRLLRRRILSAFGAVSVTLGAITGAGAIQVVTAGGGDDRSPEIVVAPDTTEPDHTPTSEEVEPRLPAAPPDSRGTPEPPSADSPPAGGSIPRASLGDQEAGAWWRNAFYPLAPSCHVDNVGLAPGESRTCRFMATASGSIGLYLERGEEDPLEQDHVTALQTDYPTAEFRLLNDSGTYTYTMPYAQAAGTYATYSSCGAVEPGDLVEVRLTASNFKRLARAGAGRKGAPEDMCAS